MKQKLTWGSRGRLGTLLLAVALSLAGLLPGVQVAHADTINPIVSGSMAVKNKTSDTTIYVWNDVEVSGQWKIPDQSGKDGDTFTIGLPSVFEGVNGSFELEGTDGATSYGTCTVSKAEVACTLNGNVVGKDNVGGTFFVNTQAATTYKGSTVSFTVNGGTTIDVPLPNGQTDIGYSPEVPKDINKIGYPTGDPYDSLRWKIRIPGQEVKGNTLTIDDKFTVPGSTLTVKPNDLTFYRIPNNNPTCWNENWTASCQTVLYRNDGRAYPDVQATIDDSSRIQLTYTKPGGLSSDDMYLLEYALSVGEEILVGAQYPNTVDINGQSYEATAVRESSGGGTGSGDTVGHLSVQKTVSNDAGNAVPSDTVFPVDYSYTVKGTVKTGTLNVKADGTHESLYNIPHGTVVTLTEKVPTVAGVDFGDPVFSGTGVTDGAPDTNSAQLTIEGSKTVAVTLTNSVNPKLAPVEVTPGVCTPGATEPSNPTVKVGTTDGITYSEPEITKNGNEVTVKVTASPATGRQIDRQDLPEGWEPSEDGFFIFTKILTQPSCTQDATLATPSVTAGVCPVDSLTPTAPVVSGIEDTDQIDYSDPVVTTEGDQVTVKVTAVAKAGYQIDEANLPSGWSLVDGVVTYTTTVTQPKCVAPALPKIDVGTCPVGSLTPTDPSATIDPVEGLEISEPKIEVVDGKVTVTASATAKDGFQIGGPLPEGWTRVDGTSATFTTTKDQPVCQPTEVGLVAPKITAASCTPGSDVPVPPTVEVPVVEHVSFGEPKVEVVGKKATITVTATPDAGYVISKTDLPEGWEVNADGTATYTAEQELPDCTTPAPPTSPSPTPSTPSTSPSPTPSVVVTPTPPKATVTPTPVKPGLPRTGA